MGGHLDDRLRLVAIARGYKRGWVYYRLQEWRQELRMTAELTGFTKANGPLTKRISLAADGRSSRTAAPALWRAAPHSGCALPTLASSQR